MGQIRSTPMVLPIVAAFAADDAWLDQTPTLLESLLGPTVEQSIRFDFTETTYYAAAMGPALKKQLFAFCDLVPADRLSALKLATNRLEEEIAQQRSTTVERPINLDPGYVDLGKFVLASTKDHAHRIYLTDGIYAEVTLHYRQGTWASSPWTYPDYQRPEVQSFLTDCRRRLQQQLRSEKP